MNPHPPLTGFPVAICFMITCCEIFKHICKKKELNTVCNYLTLFGLISFPLVYYSGFKGTLLLDKDFNKELIDAHQDLAKLFLFTCIPYLVLRTAIAYEQNLLGRISNYAKEVIETTLTFFSIIIFALALYTSHLGGDLVFKHGATVEKTVKKTCEDCKPKSTSLN